MDERGKSWGSTIRLAAGLSAVAAIVTVVLSAAGDVSATRLVIAVTVVGFVTSWIQSGRSHERPADAPAHPVTAHRTTLVPARRHAA